MKNKSTNYNHASVYCSIVFPVYNEELAINENLQFIYLKLQQLLGNNSFEIIIVDNASTDNTKSVLSKAFSYNNIVYTYTPNRGRGGALVLGFKMAKGKYIAVLSIDRAWNEDFLKDALLHLEMGADIVYGPKDNPLSIVERSFVRKVGSIIARIIIIVLFNKTLPDTQCIKVFKASEIPFLNNLGKYNYFAETEFALRAHQCDLSCNYLPVKVKDFRKQSKVRIISIFEFFLEALHFRIFHYSKREIGSL